MPVDKFPTSKMVNATIESILSSLKKLADDAEHRDARIKELVNAFDKHDLRIDDLFERLHIIGQTVGDTQTINASLMKDVHELKETLFPGFHKPQDKEMLTNPIDDPQNEIDAMFKLGDEIEDDLTFIMEAIDALKEKINNVHNNSTRFSVMLENHRNGRFVSYAIMEAEVHSIGNAVDGIVGEIVKLVDSEACKRYMKDARSCDKAIREYVEHVIANDIRACELKDGWLNKNWAMSPDSRTYAEKANEAHQILFFRAMTWKKEQADKIKNQKTLSEIIGGNEIIGGDNENATNDNNNPTGIPAKQERDEAGKVVGYCQAFLDSSKITDCGKCDDFEGCEAENKKGVDNVNKS